MMIEFGILSSDELLLYALFQFTFCSHTNCIGTRFLLSSWSRRTQCLRRTDLGFSAHFALTMNKLMKTVKSRSHLILA